jgi:hypothetical protein
VSKYPRLEDADSFPAAILSEFVAEAAFANASLSHNAHDMTFTSDGIFKLVKKRVKFVTSARQGAQTYSATKNSARGCMLKPSHLEDFNRCHDPANALRA